MSKEESKPDVVKEAREILTKASRIHALSDTDPSADEDVGWMLSALCDEVERLSHEVQDLRSACEYYRERDAAAIKILSGDSVTLHPKA